MYSVLCSLYSKKVVLCTLDCKYKVTTHPTPLVIYCHLSSRKSAKICAQQIDIRHFTSAEKFFKISQQLNTQGPHLTYLLTGISSEIQARPPLTCRDARCVRPHQSAYSIGKRVNEGRTRRASVPAKGNAIRKSSDTSNPLLALQITDYSYFETHMLPSA